MFDLISSRLVNTVVGRWAEGTTFLAQVVEETVDEPSGIFAFMNEGWVAFLALVLLVALAIFLGHFLARSLRLPEYGAKLSVIFGSIFIALLLIAANQFTPKFGIDLRGGINMIGSLNLDGTEDADPFSQSKTTAEKIIPILLRRVDPSGTREIMIRPLGTDKIEVTIPTNSKAEADEIWTRLVKTGKLQFLIVAESNFSKHNEARRLATEQAAAGNLSRTVGETTKTVDGVEKAMPLAKWFTLAKEDDEDQAIVAYKMIPDFRQLLRDSRTGRLVDVTKIPMNSRDEEFRAEEFTVWWDQNQQGAPQILLMEPDEESMRVEGKHLDANQLKIGLDERGRDSVNFEMTAEGASRMFDFTWEHKPSSEGEYRMAIVLDNQVHTAPSIEDTIQRSGRITGNFSREEVDDLIINLRSGNIDVALNDNPISSQFIESDLGQELKEKGLFAIGFSFVLVLIFMIVYYRFAGLVAAAALMLNLVFILALIMAIQQPLTLTGLAGLVLTVGMSVDANVLIFERIREELDKGAALRMAIRNGFDKATTTIIDANVTTLITAIVLYVIGTEQIKGFAVTLILGILMSMFTAIYCARAVFDICERKRWITSLSMTRILRKTDFNFISKRLVAGVFSVILIGIGIAAIFGLKDKILHHDLRGGSTVRVVFKDPPGGSQDENDGRQIVFDQLNAVDMELNGEEIEFSVSKLNDEVFPNRVFKVDSNLPIYDGEGEPHEDLADLIGRVFEGQLELLQVNVKGLSSQPELPGQPADTETGLIPWGRGSLLSAMHLTRPQNILAATLQDPAGDPSSGSSETTSDNAAASPLLNTANQQAGDAGLDLSDQSAAGTDTAEEENAFLGGVETPSDTPIPLATTKTELEFKFPVSGKELTTFIVAAGEAADLEIEPEQIRLRSPDAVEEQTISSLRSQNWTVEMNLPNATQAERIFAPFQESYNSKPYFPTISEVGGQIARDTQIQALVAIIASLLGIIAYVWIRFQNVAFGLAAVVALIHDVLIVLGAIAISHYVAGALGFLLIENFKISLPIVAALLTIIGYSLNDTIVVFDRIREVRGKRSELTADIVNTSISQTLSRTILTSMTTFLVVFILYLFGGDAIHGFAFALVIGVIVGTYSSIFVASPVLLWLMNSVGLNPGEPIAVDKPVP